MSLSQFFSSQLVLSLVSLFVLVSFVKFIILWVLHGLAAHNGYMLTPIVEFVWSSRHLLKLANLPN